MTISFALEKEKQVATISEIREALSTEFALDSTIVNITELGLTVGVVDAANPITIGQVEDCWYLQHLGEGWAMTNRAFKSFLGRLNIPYRFGIAIPEDLLDIVIHRLRDIKPQGVQLYTREGVIYGIAPDDYRAPDLSGILESLGEPWRALESLGARDIEMARVGTDGIRVATISQVAQTEPEVGDVIKAGIYLTGCHTGRPYPLARLMTYRMICSNGVVSGKSWGETRWPRGNGHSLEIFNAGLIDLMAREASLLQPLETMADRRMTDFEFSRLWRATKKVIGIETTDRLFNTAIENRQAILTSVRAKQHNQEEPAELEDFSAYEVFNSLSQFANDLPGEQAGRLMGVVGMLLGTPQVA